MRPVQLADIEMAVRALLYVPPDARAGLASKLVAQADIADTHRQAAGSAHPEYGAGALMSAAVRCPLAPRPAEVSGEALRAFAHIIRALTLHGHRSKCVN